MLKNYTKVDLPSNYAWQLLDNEIQLQLGKNIEVNLIQKLVGLYALGVEYYESLHSYKYLYFQRKMTNLMTSPRLQNIGNDQAQNQKPEVKEHKKQIKEKQEQLQKKVLYKVGDGTENKVKDILKCKQKEANDYNQKIQKSLCQQAQNIRAKLMQRKQASQLKLSQSLIQLTRHNSESSLEPSQPPQQKQKLKIDFTSIINQNQQEDSSINGDQKEEKEQKQIPEEQACKSQKKSGRSRTNTLRGNNFQRTQIIKRPKSLQIQIIKQEESD